MSGPTGPVDEASVNGGDGVEAYKDSRLYTDRCTVRELEEQYGLLRAQALTPRESLTLIEELLGET